MEKTRVLIADDHPFFRSGISQWLNQQENYCCCGEAGTVAAAREMIASTRPDVVLLDIRFPDGDGIELTRELSARHPLVRVIIISQFAEETHAHRALRSGARGYITKSEASETLTSALAEVLEGGIFLSRGTSARILHNLFPDPAAREKGLSHLSDRELEIFQMLGAGCRPREIAATLHISPKTVDTHREHLKDKLGLEDGNALIRAATVWVERGRLDC